MNAYERGIHNPAGQGRPRVPYTVVAHFDRLSERGRPYFLFFSTGVFIKRSKPAIIRAANIPAKKAMQ